MVKYKILYSKLALKDAKKLISDIADSNPAIASVSAKIESAAQSLI